MIGDLIAAISAVALVSVIRLAVPYVLAALGATLCERAGVIDLAVEAKLLVGALSAAVFAHATDSAWMGIVGGAFGGMCIAAVQAGTVLGLGANQVVVGVGLNLLALGGTRTLLQALYGEGTNSPPVPSLAGYGNPILWLAVGLAVCIPVVVGRMRFGLRLRAVGDRPEAAVAAGVSVSRTRAKALVLGGAIAGIGGAQLSLAVGVFSADMSAGRGYIALAAVILANWRPGRAAVIATLLGFADALRVELQLRAGDMPRELAQVLPYLLVLVVLAAFGGGRRPPRALGAGDSH